jgi:hypothetical protein
VRFGFVVGQRIVFSVKGWGVQEQPIEELGLYVLVPKKGFVMPVKERGTEYGNKSVEIEKGLPLRCKNGLLRKRSGRGKTPLELGLE